MYRVPRICGVWRLLKVRGLGQGYVAVRYLTPYFGYTVSPHVDWPAQCLAQRKSQKKYAKRKDRKKDKRRKISSILSFTYWVKGQTNATSCDTAWCPKHQTAKLVLLVRRTLPERERWYRFLLQVEKSFFLLYMRHLLFR